MSPTTKRGKRIASVLAGLLCAVMLTSCSLISSLADEVFGPSDDEVSSEKMSRIVEALNDQDAAALKAMFTDYAQREYGEEIDAGLEYLLGMFPDGDVEWDETEDGVSSSSGEYEYGDRAEAIPSNYHVTAGGSTYRVSFEDITINTGEPDNVGIYSLGAVLETDAGDSGPEVAFYDWGGPEPAFDKESDPGVFVAADGTLSRPTAAQIVDALNRQDAGALADLFSDRAREGNSPAIDAGLEYLLDLFSAGDVTWDEQLGGSGVSERHGDAGIATMLRSFYRLNSGGVDYRLYFAEFTAYPDDPGMVGLYAMGAAPVAETRNTVPEAYLYMWADELDFDLESPPGVYVPSEASADARMQQIVQAVDDRDTDALEALFSPFARGEAADLDRRIQYLFSLFPEDQAITWEMHDISPFDQVEGGKKVEFVKATYRVTAGDQEYRLLFSDFTVNTLVNPDNVGLYGLGVVPWTDDPVYGCVEPFFKWACKMNIDGSADGGYAGIFMPAEREAEG